MKGKVVCCLASAAGLLSLGVLDGQERPPSPFPPLPPLPTVTPRPGGIPSVNPPDNSSRKSPGSAKTSQARPAVPPPIGVRVVSSSPPLAPASPAGLLPSPLLAPGTPPSPVPPSITTSPLSVIAPNPAAPNAAALRWDAETKDYKAVTGDSAAHFTFWLTNVSSSEVLVNSVRTSCGCTAAQLPAQPWHVAPGEGGPIQVTVSLLGKAGLIAKGVTVDTSVGIKQLTVRVDIPPGAGIVAPPVATVSGTMNDGERLKNMQMALTDRQVLFKNQDCAKCHATPAKGLTDGRLVYTAVCATCHNSHLRASMVPDLRALTHPTDADFWRKWVEYGRAGSMMPAFAASEGGPLSEPQVDALVDFMMKAFPSRAPIPAVAAPVRTAGGTAAVAPHQP